MSRLAMKALLASCAVAAGVAQGAGPISPCGTTGIRYNNPPSVTLNYDLGTLGSRSKALADAIVESAAAKWNDVSTATITIGRGSDLSADITALNFSSIFDALSDGLSPVIYDSDGSITELLFGADQKTVVLGFAGSGGFGAPTCRFTEGRAVINGLVSINDARLTNVIAHELGHLIGLDHTQLDSAQGLAGSNYPLMYPIAFRTLSSLHEDDIASVTALYPDASASTSFGTLNGNFFLENGLTAVRGANIWARDVANPSRVYSVVSDYLRQSTGFFSMLLPPGTYTLHAEAVDTQFDEGSSVGPYTDGSSNFSFQPPMYVAGVPMAPLTLGNATPMQFNITAGCTATATFRFDGGGSVSGCGTPPPPTSDPARMLNISTRGRVSTGLNVMIAGFVISGSSNKTVVVTAKGPSLIPFGITNAVADPVLQLVRISDSATLATNDDWASAANAGTLVASGFAPSHSRESAILITLPPGAYTAVVTGFNNTSGTGLVEVYEVDQFETPLVNISTRGQVLNGGDVMIGGFVIGGDGPQTVAVLAKGPSLVPFGITNALANPTFTLVRQSDGSTVASNDNWQSDANAAQLTAAGFAPSNPLEAGVLVTLNPGAYTAIVSGVAGGTGVGIVEVYKVGP